MFKFGFSSDTEDSTANDCVSTCSVTIRAVREIEADEDNSILQTMTSKVKIHEISLYGIKYFDPKDLIEALKLSDNLNDISTLKAENYDSDLIPNEYEGGMKVWECTYDLLNLFHNTGIDFENTRVLDLGCGAGLLGIYAMTRGAHVYFQDYNDDVIRYSTIPNVKLNDIQIEHIKFYSGDWGSIAGHFTSSFKDADKFDYILTSETIYNRSSYPDLQGVFSSLLKSAGVVFLAAKMCYFGVGGDIPAFEDFLDQQSIFKHERCWENEIGLRRAILTIKFKN